MRRNFVVVLGVAFLAFNLRTAVTSITPLLETIDRDIGLGISAMSLVGMIPTAMFAFWGIVTPFVIRRIGLENVAIVAMVCATVGQAVRVLGDSVPLLLIASALALSGMGMGNVVAPPLVKKYFPNRIASMSMLYITLLQLGTVLPALVAVPVADATSWRFSLGWWAVLSAVAAIPWIITAISVKETAASAIPAVAQRAAPIAPWRSPVGVALAVFFGVNSLSTYAFFTWLPVIVTSSGYSDAAGGVALAVFSAMGLLAAIAAPWAAARWADPFGIVVFAVVCYLVGMAGLHWFSDSLLWPSVIFLGLGPTTFPLCLTLINLRTRTEAGSAALSGFSQGIGYTVASLGPVVFGVLHGRSGNWDSSLLFICGVMVILLIAGRVACRPRLLEDTSWTRFSAAEK